MEDNDMVFNEIELKALAFDYIAAHGNGSGMSVESEDAIFDFVNTIIKHFKGV